MSLIAAIVTIYFVSMVGSAFYLANKRPVIDGAALVWLSFWPVAMAGLIYAVSGGHVDELSGLCGIGFAALSIVIACWVIGRSGSFGVVLFSFFMVFGMMPFALSSARW